MKILTVCIIILNIGCTKVSPIKRKLDNEDVTVSNKVEFDACIDQPYP